jgi:hypothetical protein
VVATGPPVNPVVVGISAKSVGVVNPDKVQLASAIYGHDSDVSHDAETLLIQVLQQKVESNFRIRKSPYLELPDADAVVGILWARIVTVGSDPSPLTGSHVIRVIPGMKFQTSNGFTVSHKSRRIRKFCSAFECLGATLGTFGLHVVAV